MIEVSSKLKGVISLANLRLNDLNNPNGSWLSEDIQSILYIAIQLLTINIRTLETLVINC